MSTAIESKKKCNCGARARRPISQVQVRHANDDAVQDAPTATRGDAIMSSRKSRYIMKPQRFFRRFNKESKERASSSKMSRHTSSSALLSGFATREWSERKRRGLHR